MDEQLAKIKLKLGDLATAPNVNELLTPDQSGAVGRHCKEGYIQDRMSRYQWERQMSEAFKLALQMAEVKTTPWENASNVKHPLITIATLQWASRAYSGLVSAPDIVRCVVQGDDPNGQKAARAGRVSEHMNYQLIEQDEPWEEEHDKLLMTLPITGCCFKKTTKHPTGAYPRGEYVLPFDLVMDYHAKSVESCERKTHRYNMWMREIRERQLTGEYTEHDLEERATEPEFYDPGQSLVDERQGIERTTEDGPRLTLEQHCYFDLDGDGYPEPYIVTIDFASGLVHRIVNRFRTTYTEQSLKVEQLNKALQETQQPQDIEAVQREIIRLRKESPTVVRIDPAEHFTKYSFIPAPDGGIYDLGFGVLLGPLNRAVDTLINELVDSGKLQNQSSGFIGKGAKIKGGRLRFGFGEWKKVDVAGATLKESIVPLPVNTPSPVLFQLLGLLITYGEKTASVTDAMTGENPGQNTPAYGFQQMLQQGMAVYSGIFKRVYRAMRAEFRLRYKLNSQYLNPMEYFALIDGKDRQIFQKDYQGDPKDIRPTADPNTVISQEKTQKVAMIAERAQLVPGYNKPMVERMLLESMQIDDPDALFPLDEKGQPKIQPPPPPEFQMEAMKEQRQTLESQERAEDNREKRKIEAARVSAEIEKIEAEIVKIMAETGNLDQKAAEGMFRAQTERLKVQKDALVGIGDLQVKEKQIANQRSNGGGVAQK